MDTVSITSSYSISINIPRKAYTILILKIDSKANPDYDPIVRKSSTTKTMAPTNFNLLALTSIFLFSHLITLWKYFLCLK